MKTKLNQPLLNTDIDIKIKLAALWTSLMFCYIYCDYFELYSSGKLEAMLTGKSMLSTPIKVFMAAVLMSIPSLMICFSVLLKPAISRILNIFFGIFFAVFLSVILVFLNIEEDGFYVYFAVIEIILALYICYVAFKWPKQIIN